MSTSQSIFEGRHHIIHVQDMLDDLINHLRQDVEKLEEPRAQALFETSAEVLIGLKTAFKHYDAGKETAFRHEA